MSAAVIQVRRLFADLGEFYRLCKPRITLLIVFTALVTLYLATPQPPPLLRQLGVIAGVGLIAGAAAALNCLLERQRDALMRRTRRRPLPEGRIAPARAGIYAALAAAAGAAILYILANPLTMYLSLAGLIGYSLLYTLLLKPHTAQNIVLGGAAGAMPPILGWAAAGHGVGMESLTLFLIIFVWTPPHFWSLALYHRADYARAGLPMLPVVRGERYTRASILAYTYLLAAVSLLPCAVGVGGYVYGGAALVLNARFLRLAHALYRRYSDELALRTFKYSVGYLFGLFLALLLDHCLL
jgi:protoheme IX farnesyltransferase